MINKKKFISTIPKHIFVIGDLVIDHTVFVQKSVGPHQKIGNENIFQRFKRLDIAGGAANTARILAVINPGQTFLWGISGDSYWGNFRSILENSQAIDGASYNIEFRSSQDESGAQMNTITRIIDIGTPPNYNKPTHVVRYDDYGHIHVPDEKRMSILHHLQRTHKKISLDAIVINDLDMNTMTSELVKRISDFAISQKPPIPIFVDPKRNKTKYLEIKAAVIMPNLSEWCHMVEQGNNIEWWRNQISKKEGLTLLAQLSFLHLGNFRFHIIKCDELGTILLAPHESIKERYSIYLIKPNETVKKDPPPQLGCGDIMIGVLAYEAARPTIDTKHIISGLSKANVVVAAYRDMFWQRMPRFSDLEKLSVKDVDFELIAEPSIGMLYLPKDLHISLSDFETSCPELVSMDTVFRDSIDHLLADIKNGWNQKQKSIIVGSGSGSGKTTLIEWLINNSALNLGCRVGHINEMEIKLEENLWEQELKEKLNLNGKKIPHLIILDEAFKTKYGGKLRTFGIELLNFAHHNNIRFLFIDTPEKIGTMSSEFLSRCRNHFLPSLSERPQDIPLIVAKFIFDSNPKIRSIKIEAKFLLAITDATLADPNPRTLCNNTNDAVLINMKREGSLPRVFLKVEDLPREIKERKFIDEIENKVYHFSK